jgi:flagellar basal-body rod modification protein FlgD
MSNTITNVLPLNGSTTASQTQKPQNSGTADRDMFLKLLIAQLKNQDPLAPQDGMQFVSQLAQFNSLDQLININHNLEQLLAQSKSAQAGSTHNTTTK